MGAKWKIPEEKVNRAILSDFSGGPRIPADKHSTEAMRKGVFKKFVP